VTLNRGVAAEYADAPGRPITYVDTPFDQRRDQELGKRGLSEHLLEHFLTMARLHAANRYDRLMPDVEAITARPATTIRDFVARHKALFERRT
jgi:predicted NAD/FAD-binding protein